MQIKVTPAEVRAKAQQILSLQSQMTALQEQMGNEIRLLPDSYWSSQSGQAFNERFNNIRKNSQAGLTQINTHVTNLQRAADEYERVETTQNQKVSNLNTRNLFNR